MNSMKETYLEEAKELLEQIETTVLDFDKGCSKKESIESIFRAMHTLKGSSAMFGFEHIASFLHNVETTYDAIRDNKIDISQDVLDATLKTVDHITNIIDDTDLLEASNKAVHKELTDIFLGFLDGETNTSSKSIETKQNEGEKPLSSYLINFEPSSSILQNGTNPFFILDELNELGKTSIWPFFEKIEDLSNLDPTNCHTSWSIILSTDKSTDDIQDVFMFVSGESNVSIDLFYAGNAFEHEAWEKWNAENEGITELISVKELREIFKAPEVQETKEETPVDLKDLAIKKNTKDKTSSSVRVSGDKLDELMRLISELVTTQASLSLYAEQNQSPQIESITEVFDKLSRRLRDVTFGMTLIPIKNIMNRFQRLIRDVSNSLDKEVDFEVIGDETELDKSIIESLTDPLLHILRNSLDHGLETTEERIKMGKSPKGKIVFKAFYSGANVIIQISDDGKGINSESIRKKAIEKGVIKADAVLTKSETLELIFAPGFSTAKEVSDISGRGVGMDVVKTSINKLRGSVGVASEVGQGTTITITLPLTLSILDGLLVEIGDKKCIIPLSVIDKCFAVSIETLQTNFNDLVMLDEEQYPFINLREEFNIQTEYPEMMQMILINNGDRKVGITVDFIHGEYQAVLKPLGKYYAKQDFISGGSILGDGSIALVLDTNRLIKQFVESELAVA